MQAILKWNKHNCQNIVTGQTYPGLHHPWIIFTRHWAKIVVLFASFWGKWFTGARFGFFLGRYTGRHGSVLTWKYIIVNGLKRTLLVTDVIVCCCRRNCNATRGGTNTGRFANESVRQRPVRQRVKSIRQRRMSVRQRLYASYFGSQRPKYFFVCLGSGWKNEEEVVWRVNERTRNKLYGVKCWVHIFSGLFGSAVDKSTRHNWCACKGKKWPCIFCSLAALANWHSTLANRLHTLANWSLANWLVGETTGGTRPCNLPTNNTALVMLRWRHLYRHSQRRNWRFSRPP